MKILVLALLILPALRIAAQDFAPIGSIWYYDESTANTELTSYLTIESVSDTIIGNTECRKLIKTSRYGLTPVTSDLYMYSSHDSVFFYADHQFNLLYDFSAEQGDTVTLGYYTTHDGSPLKMIIDSTGSILINGQTRKVQYVTSGDGISIEFGGRVISGLGNVEYMFPHFDMWTEGPLRCYEDSACGLFKNPWHFNNGWNFKDCDQIITGTAENTTAGEIIPYPVPALSFLTFLNLDRKTEYRMYDSAGRFVKGGSVKPAEAINLSDLPGGLYSILLTNHKIRTITKRVVKLF